jgi:regulator of protease activity HflC (stomatin/prohibitin superfamily)
LYYPHQQEVDTMRYKWVIGFLVALAILALAVLLGGAAAAVLGALLLLLAVAGLATCVKVVPERTALVVSSVLHGAVVRVVPGPAVAFLRPFQEKVGERMDTAPRVERVYVEDVLQADQQPTTLSFLASVIYQLAPQNLAPADLGQILPKLTGDLSGMVRYWTDYCLSSLIADIEPAYLHNGRRTRLERHLQAALAARLGNMGIHVRGVQVKVCPPAGLQHRMLQAEQQQVDISVQSRQLAAILAALAGMSPEARDLARLKLAESLGHNGHNLVTLDLSALLAVEPEQVVPAEGVRFPQLERLLYSRD